jgi:hypothetical protein
LNGLNVNRLGCITVVVPQQPAEEALAANALRDFGGFSVQSIWRARCRCRYRAIAEPLVRAMVVVEAHVLLVDVVQMIEPEAEEVTPGTRA